MANNISMITLMFEEIKSMLTSIEKKLDTRSGLKKSPSSFDTAVSKPEVKIDASKLDQLIRMIFGHLRNSEIRIEQVSETIRESERRVISKTEELKRTIESQKPDSVVRHHHVVDLKSSKVVITIVTLVVLLLASVFGNVHQFEVNNQLKDNDLKYRYIKSINGISSKDLDKLEDIFQFHRDKNLIRKIRQEVGDYERRIEMAAEKKKEK